MFMSNRLFKIYFSAQGGAGGGAGAPGAPPTGGTPAAGAPGGEAAPTTMPAWFEAAVKKVTAPLVEQVNSLKAEKDRAAGEVAATKAEKLTVEQQIEQLKTERKGERIDRVALEAAGAFQYVKPEARDHALAAFRATHKLEAKDGGAVVAIGPKGGEQSVGEAYKAWLDGPGSFFKAAASQPGAGTLPGATPGTQPVDVKSMEPADFQKLLEQGVTGKLTPTSPYEVTLKRNTNTYAQGRESWLARAWGGRNGNGK